LLASSLMLAAAILHLGYHYVRLSDGFARLTMISY